MHLYCQSCGTQIQADDMNLATALAKCRSCHAVMNFADQLGVKPQPALAALSAHLGKSAEQSLPEEAKRPPADRPRGRAPQPENVRVRDHGDALEISSRWQSRGMGGLVVFCVFWDGFLVFWYFIAFTQNGPLMMKVFPLLHVAVGVGLTYFTAAKILNRTTVRADSERVRVWHGPIPWVGSCVLPRAGIQQLYCQSHVPGVRGTGIPSIVYDVMALSHHNRKATLLHDLPDRDQALFIEQTLEDYLGIADRPVAGELRR